MNPFDANMASFKSLTSCEKGAFRVADTLSYKVFDILESFLLFLVFFQGGLPELEELVVCSPFVRSKFKVICLGPVDVLRSRLYGFLYEFLVISQVWIN